MTERPPLLNGRSSDNYGNQVDDQTLHYLLSIFDASGDRPHPFQTRLPVNQPYLDRIATATDEWVLAEGLGLLNDLTRRGGPGGSRPCWQSGEGSLYSRVLIQR